MGLDAAAQGSVLKWAAVLQMDAETILTKLKMENAKAAGQRRLQQIFHAKKD